MSYLLPMKKDALLNKQFPFGNDLTKYVKNKKAEKHGT